MNIYLWFSITAVLVSCITALYSFISVKRLKKLYSIFGSDERPENLEEIISAVAAKIKKAESEQKKLEKFAEQLKSDLSKTLQKVGVHRFDSLADNNGKLSFCLALMNEDNTGITITSLHGREQNRVYIKTITKGKSQNQLTPEEQNAIAEAHIQWNENKDK